MFIVIILLQHC